MTRAEILAALQKNTDDMMLREPHSDFEEWLRNNLAVLISVCSEQEKLLNHICPDKSDDV